MVVTGILYVMKFSVSFIVLIGVMFYQNWKLALFAIIMIPLASIAAKSLGKRIGKVSTESQEVSGLLSTFLLEIIKNLKLNKFKR